LDCNQLWKDQFISKIEKKNSLVKKEPFYSIISTDNTKKKRRSEDLSSQEKTLTVEDHDLKRRRKSSIQFDDESASNKVDK
jgi:hypothetical protein